MSDSEIMRNPCKTYPDEPCYGCKKRMLINDCSVFGQMEYEADKCPCVNCIVKPICVTPCNMLKEFIGVEMSKITL
jgi:hypothetical protein